MIKRTCNHEKQMWFRLISLLMTREPSVDFAILGEIQYYYSVNQNIVVTEGKEINRDSISSGERT